MGSVLLVHGGWVDSSCWSWVAPALRERGHRVGVVDLPLETLIGDTAAAQRALDHLGDDVVVCGWSYGGVVITGLEATGVRHLVYVAALMPNEEESLNSLLERHPAEGVEDLLQFDDAGNVRVDGEVVDACAWPDAPADVASATRKSLRPMALQTLFDAPCRVAWRDVPSTYVICQQDRIVNPELQVELARRATHTIEWDTSHAPMLSKPGLMIELLDNLAH